MAGPAMRHRIIRSFEAAAEAVTTDDIILQLIDHVPTEYAERKH